MNISPGHTKDLICYGGFSLSVIYYVPSPTRLMKGGENLSSKIFYEPSPEMCRLGFNRTKKGVLQKLPIWVDFVKYLSCLFIPLARI